MKTLPGTNDYLIWYAKARESLKYRSVYRPEEAGGEGATAYRLVELADGTRRRMTPEERGATQAVLRRL